MNIDIYNILKLTADTLIGQSVSVLGIKGSGKSNTAAVLMEELLHAGVPILVIDIAGEYHTLKKLFPMVTVIGRSITTKPDMAVNSHSVYKIAETAYLNGSSVVFDMSGIPSDMRDELLASYISPIWSASAVQRIPLVIFLEECHNWIPQSGKTAVTQQLIDIAAEGRKRGLSLVMVGQRSSRIHKDTLTQADISILHRVRHPADIKVYQDMIPRPRRWVKEKINKLKVGEALFLIGDLVQQHTVRVRQSQHVGSTPGMSNIPSKQLSLMDMMAGKYD